MQSASACPTEPHIISFRRPGQVRTLTKMTIPKQEDPLIYIRRLENLGYSIIDISPPIAQFIPTQNIDVVGRREFFRSSDDISKATRR